MSTRLISSCVSLLLLSITLIAEEEGITITLSDTRESLAGQFMETSIPFGKGSLRRSVFKLLDADGKPVPFQCEVLANWPDQSLKWVHVAADTPRTVRSLRLVRAEASPVAGQALAQELEDRLEIDTGRIRCTIPKKLPSSLEDCVHGVLSGLCLKKRSGDLPVTADSPFAGLVVMGPNRELYSTTRASRSWSAWLHRQGPLQATILIRAQPTREGSDSLLFTRLRIDFWKDSSIVRLTATWLNLNSESWALVRDIRFRLPLAFQVERVTLGGQYGAGDFKVPLGGEIYLLQADSDQYWGMRTGWGKPDVDLASGGLHGPRAPGWAVVSGEGRKLGIWMPRFFEEYPNEISVSAREISAGFWPERANVAIQRHRILPAPPPRGSSGRGGSRQLVQPYWAFFNADKGCLELPPGAAKTQEVVLDFDPEAPEQFGKAASGGWLMPDRGVVCPVHVAASGVFGRSVPAGQAGFEKADSMLSRVLLWHLQHADGGWTWGKFDYGDLRYIVFTPQTRMGEGYKGTELAPRAGYWNNNEADAVQGLLAHFYLTGDRRAWNRALVSARHLADVDLHHGEEGGLHPHTFGHTAGSTGYRALDHLWVQGLVTWYQTTGDPFLKEDLNAVWRMALRELRSRPFAEDTLRNFSMGIASLVQAFRATGERNYLDAACEAARQLMLDQAEEGYFPAAGLAWAKQHEAAERFPGESRGPTNHSLTHAMDALRLLHEDSGDRQVERSFVKAMYWMIRYGLYPAKDAARLFLMPKGEPSPQGDGLFRAGDFFLLPLLAYAYRITGDREFAIVGACMLRNLAESQLGRRSHPLWEGIWFEHPRVLSVEKLRTVPQDPDDPHAVFNYITPLSASFSLYKTREMLCAIRDAGVLNLLTREP